MIENEVFQIRDRAALNNDIEYLRLACGCRLGDAEWFDRR